MIPANGLLLFPEASAGCTCSFPLRTTLVLKPQKEKETGDWSVFVSHGPVTPVKRLGINLGAPGDKKDVNGNIWFGYPRPRTGYGVRFKLNETIADNMGYFAYDFRDVEIDGTNTPWLYTSGCAGLSKCEIKLLDEAWDINPAEYTVRLGFYSPQGDRVFDVKLQDQKVLQGFNTGEETGAVVKEFKHIKVDSYLKIELLPQNQSAGIDEMPVINTIEIIREDTPSDTPKTEEKLTKTEIKRLIRDANKKLSAGNKEEALLLYHKIFNETNSLKIKETALKGMEKIASVESLPVIEDYIRQSELIFWNYNKPDPSYIDRILQVYVAIADNLIDSNPKKAKIMLENAEDKAHALELKDKISAALLKLGGNAGGKLISGERLVSGIHYDYFTGSFTTTDALDDATPTKSGIIKKISLEKAPGVNQYGYIFRGYLFIPKDGEYTFYVDSNDGGKLYINGRELVDNDGAHAAKEESGSTVVRKGYYPIKVKYFQMGGAQKLALSWQGPGFSKKEITKKDLFIKLDK